MKPVYISHIKHKSWWIYFAILLRTFFALYCYTFNEMAPVVASAVIYLFFFHLEMIYLLPILFMYLAIELLCRLCFMFVTSERVLNVMKMRIRKNVHRSVMWIAHYAEFVSKCVGK